MYAIDWYEDCLARAFQRLGRTEEAVAEYQRVLSIYPRLATAWYGLGKTQLARGDAASARLAFRQAAGIWSQGDNDIPELMEARAAAAGR